MTSLGELGEISKAGGRGGFGARLLQRVGLTPNPKAAAKAAQEMRAAHPETNPNVRLIQGEELHNRRMAEMHEKFGEEGARGKVRRRAIAAGVGGGLVATGGAVGGTAAYRNRKRRQYGE